MLPAANKGVGMNMGFPDVCLTPAGPAVVPIPYPNIAMNAMAAPFLPTILLTCMPALNMGSMIPMTMGDEPGVAHPFFKQMGRYTLGNPKILLQALPGIQLTAPTSGNMMNNPVGAVLVPSATTVLFSLAGAPPDREALSHEHLRALAASPAVDTSALAEALSAEMLPGGVGLFTIRVFCSALPALFHAAVERLKGQGMTSVILDLRGNPGGDVRAFVELSADFLAAGSVIVTEIDADGDSIVRRSRRDMPYPWPAVILVDRRTASSAELFAASLRANGRAVIAGETTHGKGAAQAAVVEPSGRTVYATVATFAFPDGAIVQGQGVAPDLPWPPGEGEGALEEWQSRAAPLPEALRAALLSLAA